MYTGYHFTLCARKQYKLEIIDEVRGKNYVKQKALADKEFNLDKTFKQNPIYHFLRELKLLITLF